MGTWQELETPQGRVRTWHATPANEPLGGIVLIQEIFGVNGHIRDVAERFAAEGFEVATPPLFDPVEPNVELGYDAEGIARGRELVGKLGFENAIAIVGAAADWLRGRGRTVGAVGFCWGGSVALLANTRLALPSVSYYGARSMPFLDEPLLAPMMFHFGERDRSIPPEDVEAHRHKHPLAEVYTYDAGHGFNCDRRDDYDPTAAAQAWSRTVRFFKDALA
ncbi:dienelactone hydrolase family protein [Cognatilysobacter terrigena]|uniref:dienelactone hydrolase family protein n=1 Tax=Cognatilysobacter terrigena TaxID=2488749 RepID=UPI00105F10EE|nr:dienelactone hydrolase family protein [Lysobacter terrigena]